MPIRLWKSPLFHAFLLFIVLLVPAWFSIAPLNFFVSDNGLRYLQVQELIEHRWRTFAIDYEMRYLDPELVHVPYYNVYYLIKDEIFLSISPFVPLLASFFVAALGKLGLVVVPVLGAVLTAVAVYRLAGLASLAGKLPLLWASILATPLFFFSLTFWDMTFGTALAVGATAFAAHGILRKRLLSFAVAGVLASSAFAQRVEIGVFAAALGLSLILVDHWNWRAFAAYVVGGITGFLPFALLNFVWVGHPLGVVTARRFGYGLLESYLYSHRGYAPLQEANPLAPLAADIQELGKMLIWVERGDPVTFLAAILLVLAVTLTVFSLRIERYRQPRLLYAGLALALVAYTIWARAGWAGAVKGIFSTLPLVVLAVVFVDRERDSTERRQIYLLTLSTVAIFVALLMILLPGPGGLQWGVRYLLPVYPLLMFVSFYVYDVYMPKVSGGQQEALKVVFYGLFIASFLLQLVGVRFLFQEKQVRAEDRSFLAALPVDLIILDHPFIPSLMVALEDKEFLYVADQESFDSLLVALRDNGIDRFAFMETLGYPIAMPESIGGTPIVEESEHVYRFVNSPANASLP